MKIREGSAPDFQELQKLKAVDDIFGITQQEQTDFANFTEIELPFRKKSSS